VNPFPFQVIATLGLGTLLLGLWTRSGLRLSLRLSWSVLWTGALTLVWFPDLSTWLARMLGITRGVDVVMYLSIGVLSGLVFRLYAHLERQERVITKLVSELALRDGGESQIR